MWEAYGSLFAFAFIRSADGHTHCIFDQQSPVVSWWDSYLVFGVIYSTAYTPLVIVFHQAHWTHHEVIDVILDCLFSLDMLIRFRTSYRDHGYDVTHPPTIAMHYLRGWFVVDFFSSLPFDRMLAVWRGASALALHARSPVVRVVPISLVDVVSLLRIMRIGRLVRKLSTLNGANFHFLRVVCLMYFFVLFGHWLGLVWYVIAIRPIEADEAFDAARPWLWTLEEDTVYFVALRYVCSLYWALSVMTNLKGPPAHETRQCLWHEPEHSFMVNPLAERVYTIFVFIVGCVLFSCIYGNINQFIQNLYASGMRYRKRMEELDEFAKFHRLSPQLRGKIRSYVDFQWSVTKGINVDTIAAGLPAHLQIEMRLQLNKRLVEQVSIFAGCPREFFEALLSKLQPCICVAGDFVFYELEIGSRMYFIKRGVAQVGKGDTIFATFKEGDYFGEVALLTDQPRSASVIAVTDLMLLSLSCGDLEEVLTMFPTARTRIEAAAQERLKAIAKADSAAANTATKTYLSNGVQPNRRGSWGMRPPTQSRSNSLVGGTIQGRDARVRRASHRLLSLTSREMACGGVLTASESTSSSSGDLPNRTPAARRAGRRASLDSRPVQTLDEGASNALCSLPLSEPKPMISPTQLRRQISGDMLAAAAAASVKEAAPGARQGAACTRTLTFRRSRKGAVAPALPPAISRLSKSKPFAISIRRSSLSSGSSASPPSVGASRLSKKPISMRKDGSRRRSVDAGLDLAQHVPSSSGVMSAGNPMLRPELPAQWAALHTSGSSTGRRTSKENDLRRSLDAGFETPDDTRRRNDQRRRSRLNLQTGVADADWPGEPSSGESPAWGVNCARAGSASTHERFAKLSHQTHTRDDAPCGCASDSSPADDARHARASLDSVEDGSENASSSGDEANVAHGSSKARVNLESDTLDDRIRVLESTSTSDSQANSFTRKANISSGAITRARAGQTSVVKAASKFAETLATRRQSLQQRRRSLSGGNTSPHGSKSTTAMPSSIMGLTEEVLQAKLKEALKPLMSHLALMHSQQDASLTATHDLWNEMKHIARRLNQLDGNWM